MGDTALDLDGVDDAFVLNASQQGMLYHSLAEPGTGVYVGVLDCRLPDDLDLDLFKAAWAHVIARHDALRSLFVWQGVDDPLQVVQSEATINWETLDGTLPAAAGLLDRQFVETIRQEGIDLSSAPAMRFILGDLPDGGRCFLWVCHHALIDDWSQALVLEDVQKTYRALQSGQAPDDTGGFAIGAFADWIAARDTEDDEAFWRDLFAGFATPARLQLERASAPAQDDTLRGEAELWLDEDASQALREAANKHRVTLAAMATGVWSVVLHRLTGETDLAFGIAATQRPVDIQDADRAIGNFVTTMPARVQINDHENLAALIRQCHDTVQAAQPRSSIALTRLQEILSLPQDTPMIDTILSIKQDALGRLNDSGPALFQAPKIQFKSNFPLAVVVLPEERIGLRVIYDPKTYAPAAARQVIDIFESALRAAPDVMHAPPHTLPIMSAEDETRAVKGLQSPTPMPEFEGVVATIRRCAAERPEHPAIVTGDKTISYAQLLEQAEQLAHRLVAQGLGRGDRIGVYLDRSGDVPIAMLAVLLSGAAYAPFDAAFPETRLERMIKSARLSAIVTRRNHFARLAGQSSCLIDIEDTETAPDPSPSLRDGEPDDPAYVMFTSGSTGTPKGVIVTRANLDASTAARLAWYDAPPERYLLLSSHAFDSSVAGIYWTLCTGGTLHIPDHDQARDVGTLRDMIVAHDITHTLCLPSLYSVLLETSADSLTSFRTIIVAGEEVTADLLSAHQASGLTAELVNEYGPTEATVWCAAANLTGGPTVAPVPIGGPVPGVMLFLRDAMGRPVPDGMVAELLVGGPGVAAGYLDLPDETNASFVAHPDTPHERLYKTGDLVRRRADGELEYIGRADEQLKLRGYRIELPEIENLLSGRPDIRDAVVAARGDGAAARLVAYVVSKEDSALSPDILSSFCRGALPDYMVPAQFMLLADLPRTPNGKIDRKALPDPQEPVRPSGITKASTPTESVLTELWRQVLWLDREVGVHDDFHDLGGHSLLVMRLVNEIEQTFDLRIPLASLGRLTTVAEQAVLIEKIRREGGEEASVADPVSGVVPSVLAGLDPEEESKLRTLAANWRAPAAREGSKIRVMNAEGTKPPLFFCFLNEYSFVQLGKHIGKDQPLYGMRGANAVVPMTGEEAYEANMRRAAISYLEEVIELAGDGPILLGGYCQGGTIAMHLAALLTALGHTVETVMLVEKTPPVSYPGHVDILFSEKSFLNPYLEFDQPEAVWSRRYGSHSFQIVPGDYIDVFLPQYVMGLASALNTCIETALRSARTSLPRSAQIVSWVGADIPGTLRPGQQVALEVAFQNDSAWDWLPTRDTGLRVRAEWISEGESDAPQPLQYGDLERRVAAGEPGAVFLNLAAPMRVGSYRLEIDLVEEGVARFSKIGCDKLTLLTNVAGQPAVASAADGHAANARETAAQAWVQQAANLSDLTRATLRRDGALADRITEETSAQVKAQTVEIMREIGALRYRQGKPDAAEREFSAALAMDPSDAESLLGLARINLEKGRLLKAYGLTKKAHRAGSSEAETMLSAYFTPRGMARALKHRFVAKPTGRKRARNKKKRKPAE